MRCPKCQYISFGNETRCRNCGYDFSLSIDDDAIDLSIRNGEPLGPLADLPLADRPRSTAPPASAPGGVARSDLPLFADPGDDRPMVTPPAVPRAPLSVRKGAPALPRRPRADAGDEPELDLEDEEPFSSSRPPARFSDDAAAPATLPPTRDERVSPGRRALGAVIDLAILGIIDAAVVYLTLRACGLEPAQWGLLPRPPLIGFLLLLNGGYLVMFTAAGGQTIGKMATGIRVVPNDPVMGVRVPFAMAVVRAAAYGASLLPAGLGFVPILFSADGRALHDRLADTRVIQA